MAVFIIIINIIRHIIRPCELLGMICRCVFWFVTYHFVTYVCRISSPANLKDSRKHLDPHTFLHSCTWAHTHLERERDQSPRFMSLPLSIWQHSKMADNMEELVHKINSASVIRIWCGSNSTFLSPLKRNHPKEHAESEGREWWGIKRRKKKRKWAKKVWVRGEEERLWDVEGTDFSRSAPRCIPAGRSRRCSSYTDRRSYREDCTPLRTRRKKNTDRQSHYQFVILSLMSRIQTEIYIYKNSYRFFMRVKSVLSSVQIWTGINPKTHFLKPFFPPKRRRENTEGLPAHFPFSSGWTWGEQLRS